MPARNRTHFLIAVVIAVLFCPQVNGQTAVTLSPAASPTSGQPGITVINLTGSGFPTGTIQPTSVTVSLQPSAGGSAVTTPSSAVTTIVGTTRRVTFTIPAPISVTTPTAYAVSISGTTTTNTTFASSNTAALTVNPAAQIISVSPATGTPGQIFSVTITGAFTNFVQGSTVASFGAGISVGAAAEGAAGPVTVSSSTTASAQLVIDVAASLGARAVTLSTGTQTATLAAGFTVATSPLTITDFAPKSGTVGTIVTIIGSNFGSAPQVSMPALNGGSIALPLQSVPAGSVKVVIPSGAVTGLITVASSGGSAATATPFTVNAASTFTLSESPSTANLIQGQSVAFSVQLSSTNGFNQLAPLSVSGLPSGITSSFKPSSITAGQTSILMLTAPIDQAVATASISISAAGIVTGIAQTQSTSAMLNVTAPTTSLLGRTVGTDSLETALTGVTVSMLGKDGSGRSTGCSGSAQSDGSGNFALTNLAASCVGPQLVSFDASTVTSPAGKYEGVSLVFPMKSGLVTASPVLVHLPRIDTAETFMVQQNAAADQTYAWKTIPGLSVVVYAGTTLTLPNGDTPHPFPLTAVAVPADRLPDIKPPVPTMLGAFYVSFSPASSHASLPVAVSYPNTLNTPAGTTAIVLMTLDPTQGAMVPYGTGTVSVDGTQIVPDPDPAHPPTHRYGLQNFDWHAAMPQPSNVTPSASRCILPACMSPGPPSSSCGCTKLTAGNGGSAANLGGSGSTGDPIDLASGLHVINATDISILGTRGSIAIQRTFVTLNTNDGPFGSGSQMQYGWQLDTSTPDSAAAINLVSPDNNRFLFSRQPDSTLSNASVPWLQGSVMTTNASGVTNLRFRDGSIYQFQAFGGLGSGLVSITDRNNNTISLTLASIGNGSNLFLRITRVTDPVGRSLNLIYDTKTHVTSVTDPIGRTVSYTYNPSGTLATVTDAAGGVTQYQYDSQNRLTSMIDPRGFTMFQNSYDNNGRVVQQAIPLSGTINLTYVPINPTASTSPVILTTVTDPLGNQTTYRFNAQGYVTDVTDALGRVIYSVGIGSDGTGFISIQAEGQTKSFIRDPGTNQVLQITGSAQCDICGPPGMGPVSLTYDGQGNMLTSTDALGNTTKYTYEPVFNQVASITDPLGHTAAFGYDASGNLTSATDENGNKSAFTYDSTGLLLQATDPLGNKTSISYDQLGNPISVTDPLGNVSTSTFDAVSRLLSAADPQGRASQVAYDALDRIVSSTDGRGSKTQFSYDPVGNLLKLTDARGNTTSFVYDALNRVTRRTSPLGKSESYQYDLNGNLTQFTDRRGQISRYQYDALNRLAKATYQDGATVIPAYDPYSRPITINDSVGGIFGFGYDANGSLVSQTEPTGSISYTRDQLQRVATRQVAGQNTVTYSYDPAGNLLGSSMPGAGLTYSYDARSLPVAASRTNGVATSVSYDPLGRVLALTHVKGAAKLNTQAYSYDQAGYLSGASNDISQPLITQASAATVDQANELLTSGATAYTSDANGNRLTEAGPSGTLTYQWDSRNRLSSITDASGNTTFMHYDFARNLLGIDRTSGGLTTTQKFLVDSLTNVVSLTDASGLPISVLTGQSIDSHFASVDSAGNTAFGIGDALGSTVGVTGSTGSITSKLDYEPYGQTTGAGLVTYPFAYTGRVPAVGNIYYYRSRYYDAGVDRFLSEDPLGFVGGLNAYAYGGSDPTSDTDPSGTKWTDQIPVLYEKLFNSFQPKKLNWKIRHTFAKTSANGILFGLLTEAIGEDEIEILYGKCAKEAVELTTGIASVADDIHDIPQLVEAGAVSSETGVGPIVFTALAGYKVFDLAYNVWKIVEIVRSH